MKLNIACATNVFPRPWVNIDRTDLETDYFAHIRGLTPDQMGGWPEEQVRHVKWLQEGNMVFVQRDLRKGFPDYADGSIDAIYAGQMIEHLQPNTEAPAFLAECFRMLKPGGRIRLTTPDLNLLIRAYVDVDMEPASLSDYANEQPEYYRDALEEDKLAFIMYGAGGTDDRYEGHQHLYTERSLRKRLDAAGFSEDRIVWSTLFTGCIDKGMSHSFSIEAVKP